MKYPGTLKGPLNTIAFGCHKFWESGIWIAVALSLAVASCGSGDETPQATVPGAPTAVVAALGNSDTSAVVSFSAPADDGGAAITQYTAMSSPGNITATGYSKPILVTGLTAGTSYTFMVTATNSEGTGAASIASNPVIPAAPPSPMLALFAGNLGGSGNVDGTGGGGKLLSSTRHYYRQRGQRLCGGYE